jgi:hypothetical protein
VALQGFSVLPCRKEILQMNRSIKIRGSGDGAARRPRYIILRLVRYSLAPFLRTYFFVLCNSREWDSLSLPNTRDSQSRASSAVHNTAGENKQGIGYSSTTFAVEGISNYGLSGSKFSKSICPIVQQRRRKC